MKALHQKRQATVMSGLSVSGGWAAMSVLCAALLSCGGSPELIDRTQPNYLAKSELIYGTWYLQETVVDVPPTTPISFVGYTTGLTGVEKVRFEVQEHHLVAYRAFELIPGMDPNVDRSKSTLGRTVTRDGAPYRGAPVAAWPIVSHFDRQRTYNAATGEQSNVLVEDTQDRPWYERDFIRVDWANNVIHNLNNVSNGGVVSPRGNKAMQIYVTPLDQNLEDDAFVTQYRQVDGIPVLDYFDFTVRAVFDPAKVYYPGYGELPFCFLNPSVDCQSAEVKVRTSLARVDDERVADYEPLPYGDRLNKKFGFYRTERNTYDPNRGLTESGRLLYANRHNLWKKAHDSKGKVIPLAQREVRPIVYYLASGFPKELLPEARALEKSWDTAFRRAVAVPRGLEPDQVEQVFYVCETPVPAGAPDACGKEGFSVRLGDLRYSQIVWVDQPQLAGPLGFGPVAADPETGEILSGVAYIYGAQVDAYAGNAHSILDVLSGTLTIEQLLAAKDKRDYVFEHLNPTDPRRPASGPWQSEGGLVSSTRPLASFGRTAGTLQTQVQGMVAAKSPPRLLEDRATVVASKLTQHPALEAELLDAPEVRALVLQSAPGATLRRRLQTDPALYREVARQTLLRTGELQKLAADRLEWASRGARGGCIYLAEFADDAMVGLAKELAARYRTRFDALKAEGQTDANARAQARDEGYQWLRGATFKAVTEHELGHTFGMMHNFAGSFDAMNYQDGYWDLRKQTIGVLAGGKRVLPSTPANLLLASKPNQAQLDGQMSHREYSSIMDYGSRMNSDLQGIGKYDAAAILFVYGGGPEPGYVEVFQQTRMRGPPDYDEPNTVVETDVIGKSLLVRGAHAEIPLAHVEHYTPASLFYSDRFHYTTLPFHFADKNLSFDAALEQGLDRMKRRSFRKWSDMEIVYLRIEAVLDRWYRDVGNFVATDWEKASSIVAVAAPNAPVEVPFMFCSDYEVGASLACNRWDKGADVFEVTTDWLERYRNYYAFNSFRRDRVAFGSDSYWRAIDSRYLGNLPNVYQQWLFNIYLLQSAYGYTAEQVDRFFGLGDPIYQNYWTMAVIDGTNALMRNLTTPAAGYHGRKGTGNWVALPMNGASGERFAPAVEAKLISDAAAAGYSDVVYIPRGPGRSMYSLYDEEGFEAYTRVNEVGHFWDQVASMGSLTTSTTQFLGVDRGSDALRYSIPYYLIFNKELSGLFSNVWLGREGAYASRLVRTGNGQATAVAPTFIRGETFIDGFDYPPAPALVDGNGNPLPVEYVEATPTWSTRFYAEFWGMGFFTSNFDQEFANFNNVYRLGSGESLSPAPGYVEEKLLDPFGGGYTYAALKKSGDPSPPAAPSLIASTRDAAQKWESAKTSGLPVDGLTAAQWEAKTREGVRLLELMRAFYAAFGRAL